MTPKKQKNFKLGFTIIEIMVVCVIIGVLAATAAVSYQKSLAKSRDSRRISDLNAVKRALEIYYEDNSTFAMPSDCNCGNNDARTIGSKRWGWISADTNDVKNPIYNTISIGQYLANQKYLEQPVQDPSGNDACVNNSTDKAATNCGPVKQFGYRLMPLEAADNTKTVYKHIGIFGVMELNSSIGADTCKNAADPVYGGTLGDDCTTYGMNYSLEIDKSLP